MPVRMRTITMNKGRVYYIGFACVTLFLIVVYSLSNNVDVKTESLTYRGGHFYLNKNKFRVLSGAVHYFRVVPVYWEDRLEKLKAAGLNTVETYMPWNLHELRKGHFNFEDNLDIRQFIKTAQRLGLYVIVRPGPYICAEWEFGGLPSWLLHDPAMKIRSTYPGFLEAVDKYFKRMMLELVTQQYSHGGPIIAMQIENEYGSYGEDKEYMMWLKKRLLAYGASELLFTSDNGVESMERGSIPGTLITANFKQMKKGLHVKKYLQKIQPEAPFMVMEFWSGWFDHWLELVHHTWDVKEFEETLQFLVDIEASINFYMMHGGTNFGFMNGANVGEKYQPTITSYDYDAPIAENGDLTQKYYVIQRLLQKTSFFSRQPVVMNISSHAYGNVKMETMMNYKDYARLVHKVPVQLLSPVPMEYLNTNEKGGQGYGYILYSIDIKQGGTLSFAAQHYVWVLLDGVLLVEVPWYAQENKEIQVVIPMLKKQATLDILVENMGRANFDASFTRQLDKQRTGITSLVKLNGQELTSWHIYSLEFENYQALSITNRWKPAAAGVKEPTLYKGKFVIPSADVLKDTFLQMPGWGKGAVILNGFNLGRYWSKGPQQTLYVPAPLLRHGENEIMIFENGGSQDASLSVNFVARPNLGSTLKRLPN